MSAGPARLHLITGGRYHDFDLARLTLLTLMAERPEIRATCAQDFSGVHALEGYRGVVLYTCDLMPGDDEAAALDGFVRSGGRLFALHAANAALEFTDGPVIEASGVRIPGLVKPTAPHIAPQFMELIGARFVAHLPAQPVRCEIVDHDHALTRGMRDFTVTDEPYVMTPLTPFRTLISARYGGEATGYQIGHVADDGPRPQLFVKDHGAGGVLYSPLGHACGRFDLKPLMDEAPVIRGPWDDPAYLEILRRGLAWAAGTA